ncbi:MAG: CPBP family intramembrane metalloprotease [Verrucomicrobia bacterium]|nr:CPBP family intramembrane metalloprotease [Verrucomicrobiota bacterium]
MTDPVFTVALGAELVLVLGGLALLWRLKFARDARQSAAPVRLAPWDAPASEFLLYLWLIIAGAFCLLYAAGFVAPHLPFEAEERLNLTGVSAHLGALLGLVIFWRVFARRSAAPAPMAPGPGIFLSGFATFLISIPLVYAVAFLWQGGLQLCGIDPEPQDLIAVLRNSNSTLFQGLMIVAATIVVPIAEESLFRGGLFRYARGRVPRWVALTVPALLFGAMHANLSGFLPLSVLGLIFALAYERTGRLGTSIVAHGLFNLHSVVMLFTGVGT